MSTTFLFAHVSKSEHGDTHTDIAQAKISATNESEARKIFEDRFPQREVTSLGVEGLENA